MRVGAGVAATGYGFFLGITMTIAGGVIVGIGIKKLRENRQRR